MILKILYKKHNVVSQCIPLIIFIESVDQCWYPECECRPYAKYVGIPINNNNNTFVVDVSLSVIYIPDQNIYYYEDWGLNSLFFFSDNWNVERITTSVTNIICTHVSLRDWKTSDFVGWTGWFSAMCSQILWHVWC